MNLHLYEHCHFWSHTNLLFTIHSTQSNVAWKVVHKRNTITIIWLNKSIPPFGTKIFGCLHKQPYDVSTPIKLGIPKVQRSLPNEFCGIFSLFWKMSFVKKKTSWRMVFFQCKMCFSKKTLKLLRNQRMGKIY